MNPVLIKKPLIDKIHKIYEKDDVHYFYWPVEIGVGGKIKIWKLNIPTFPLKFFDWEPIKIINYKGNIGLLSRFHYRIITYFNNLKLDQGNPIIKFFEVSHTPLGYSDTSILLDLGSNNKFVSGVNSKEINAFIRISGIFCALLKGTLKFDAEDLNDLILYNLDVGEVPDEFIFQPESMAAIIWFGKRPSNDELKLIGYKY